MGFVIQEIAPPAMPTGTEGLGAWHVESPLCLTGPAMGSSGFPPLFPTFVRDGKK